MNADEIAGLPGGCILRPYPGQGRRPMILRSQAEANAACERVGWTTIHPNKATKEATMSTTKNQTKLTLSCGHVKPVEGETPAVGDKVHCAKCPGTKSGEMALRTVKTIGAPGQTLASHEASVAADVARSSSPAQNGNADLPSRQDTAEALTEALTSGDTTSLERIVEKVEAADAEIVEFPDAAARYAAAKEAGKAAKAQGRNAGEASAKILSMPIRQAPVEDRSDSSPRQRTGRLGFLNLSPVRAEALQAALTGKAVETADADEKKAAKAIAEAAANGDKQVNFEAPGVRVMLRNLGRVAADSDRPEKVRNAAQRTADWLDRFADEAGYSAG